MGNFAELLKNKRYFIPFCAVLLALVILMSFAIYQSYSHYIYKGNRLKIMSVTENSVIMEDENGNDLRFTADMTPGNPVDGSYEVRYLDDVIKYSVNFENDACTFTFSDQSIYVKPAINVIVDDNDPDMQNLNSTQIAERDLIYKLIGYYENQSNIVAGLVWAAILGCVLFLLGLLFLAFPEKAWAIRNIFNVIGGEPTDFAIFVYRVSGLIFILGPFIFLIVFAYSYVF